MRGAPGRRNWTARSSVLSTEFRSATVKLETHVSSTSVKRKLRCCLIGPPNLRHTYENADSSWLGSYHFLIKFRRMFEEHQCLNGTLSYRNTCECSSADRDDPIPPSYSPHTRDVREDGIRAITVEIMWGAPKVGQGGHLFTQTRMKRADAPSVPEESRLCQ